MPKKTVFFSENEVREQEKLCKIRENQGVGSSDHLANF